MEGRDNLADFHLNNLDLASSRRSDVPSELSLEIVDDFGGDLRNGGEFWWWCFCSIQLSARRSYLGRGI